MGQAADGQGAGGPRMCCARAKISITIMGAPQCRQTKGGRMERDAPSAAVSSVLSAGAG